MSNKKMSFVAIAGVIVLFTLLYKFSSIIKDLKDDGILGEAGVTRGGVAKDPVHFMDIIKNYEATAQNTEKDFVVV